MTTTKKISELPSAVTPLVGDEDIPIVQSGATRRVTPDDLRNGLSADGHSHTLSDISDAGTAAASDTGDFATAAQGALADTALQNAGAFATAAQGTKADTATQPGDLASVATSGAYEDLLNRPTPGQINAIINGHCVVSHRGDLSLSTSWQYGAVDLLAVKAEGTVSAGTIKRFSGAYTLTTTGLACMVENATLTGSGAILFRHRIESKDARHFYNKGAYFLARTYHDIGSTQNYIITVNKADAEDDFSAVTEIESATVTVAHNTNDDIALSVADMGDCRNGIEIEIKIDCGAITTKDIFLGQLQFTIGAFQQVIEFRPAAVEEELVRRFVQPAVIISAVANSGSNMQASLSHPNMRDVPSYEQDAALDMTDGYAADHSQSSANIGTVHENSTHRGRVDIALFSGLTSGRHYIHRGAGGTILASAEL